MNFRVGQKVVCVNDEWDARRDYISYPTDGQTYTVREVFRPCCKMIQADHPVCVRLVEIRQEKLLCDFCSDVSEMEFDARRFRPLVERKTDISAFMEMLKPKHRERVSP